MMNRNKRKVRRSQAWPDVEATLKVHDSFLEGKRGSLLFKGEVGDLSSGGMFFKTSEAVPVPAMAEITIDFGPSPTGNGPNLLLAASGETVRTEKNGVGVKFTDIDLAKLQQCIIAKMNMNKTG